MKYRNFELNDFQINIQALRDKLKKNPVKFGGMTSLYGQVSSITR